MYRRRQVQEAGPAGRRCIERAMILGEGEAAFHHLYVQELGWIAGAPKNKSRQIM